MSKHHHDEGGELHFEQVSHHGVTYEPRDLGGRAIIVFLIVLVVSTAVLALVVWGYYHWHLGQFAEEPASTGAQVSQNMPGGEHPKPAEYFPKPALQPDDVSDMNQLNKAEDQVLNSYAILDQKSGTARIPIDEAMKLVVQKGLPVRPAQPQSTAAQFGSGTDTVPGIAGGTRPVARQ
jgi:hypothetical protein